MGNSSTIAIYDNHHGNGSKSHISTRPSYFSIEELPSTLEEGFRFRPSHPRDEEEGDEENEDDYDDDNHDNDAVQRGNGKWKPGVKEWLVLICVSIVVMMDAFDATVIIPLVSRLSHTFNRPLENILWLATGYLLSNAGGQVIFAMLTEIFALGPLLVAALVFATAGTGVCGGSLAFPELLAGQVVQGIGGGGAMAISLLIVMDSIPSPYWARYTGWLFTVRVVGAMVGPLLGGLVIDYARFNWGFYFNFVFCALSLLIVPFAVDLREKKGASLSRLRRLDWPGCILTLLGIGAFLIGLGWGGTEFTWNEWETFIPIAVGGGMMVCLVVWEILFASQPLFTLRALNPCSMVMAYISSFLHGLVLFCHLLYLILYLTSAKYLARSVAGLSAIAITGQALIIIFLMGQTRFLRRLQSTWIIRAGWAITIVATGCLIILNKRSPTIIVIVMFLVAGTGHGLLIPGYHTYFTKEGIQKQRNESDHEEGDISVFATSVVMYSFLRTMGMCIAVPVAGTILLGQLILQMKQQGLNTSNEYFIRLNEALLSEGQKDELEILDGTGFRLLWQVITGVAGLGGLLSLFIKRAAA